MQNRVPERQALRQRLAANEVGNGAAEFGGRVDAGDGAREQVLGEHHGRGLQHFDIFVGILALGLVLDGEDAQHLSAAQQRDCRKEW
jgi:hypothetical protein